MRQPETLSAIMRMVLETTIRCGAIRTTRERQNLVELLLFQAFYLPPVELYRAMLEACQVFTRCGQVQTGLGTNRYYATIVFRQRLTSRT